MSSSRGAAQREGQQGWCWCPARQRTQRGAQCCVHVQYLRGGVGRAGGAEAWVRGQQETVPSPAGPREGQQEHLSTTPRESPRLLRAAGDEGTRAPPAAPGSRCHVPEVLQQHATRAAACRNLRPPTLLLLPFGLVPPPQLERDAPPPPSLGPGSCPPTAPPGSAAEFCSEASSSIERLRRGGCSAMSIESRADRNKPWRGCCACTTAWRKVQRRRARHRPRQAHLLLEGARHGGARSARFICSATTEGACRGSGERLSKCGALQHGGALVCAGVKHFLMASERM